MDIQTLHLTCNLATKNEKQDELTIEHKKYKQTMNLKNWGQQKEKNEEEQYLIFHIVYL